VPQPPPLLSLERANPASKYRVDECKAFNFSASASAAFVGVRHLAVDISATTTFSLLNALKRRGDIPRD